MFKVIIADDEPLIRRGLKGKVNWHELGFEIVAEARNGLEALEMARAFGADAIISDMKMPVADGIKLLEALSENNLSIKVVVISAYSSFNYTHTAIKHGAFDYILKPIDSDELTDVLKRLKAALEYERQKAPAGNDTNTSQEALPGFKDNFFKSFNSSVIIDKTGLLPKILDLDMRLDYKKYTCLVVSIPELTSGNPLQALEPIRAIMLNNVLHTGFAVTVFENPLYQNNFFAILGYDNPISTIQEFVENIQADIVERVKSNVTIGIGSSCNNFNEINKSFTQALNALNCRSIVSESCIIFNDDLKPEDNKPIIYSSEKEKAFLTALEICNRNEMEFNIHQLFNFIKTGPDISFRQVYKLCSELLFLCERIVRNHGGTLEDIFIEDITSIDYIACKGSLVQLEQWFCQVVFKIMQFITDKKSKNLGRVIDDILKYIDANYFESITLNEVSIKYHINKSYLSALFKKRTSQTFVDYVTAVRMNKAAELLKNKKYKVYEIARLVGYTDERYFSKLFKKYHGVLPVHWNSHKDSVSL